MGVPATSLHFFGFLRCKLGRPSDPLWRWVLSPAGCPVTVSTRGAARKASSPEPEMEKVFSCVLTRDAQHAAEWVVPRLSERDKLKLCWGVVLGSSRVAGGRGQVSLCNVVECTWGQGSISFHLTQKYGSRRLWWMSLSRSCCLPRHSGANAIMSPEPLRRLLGLCFPTTSGFLVNDSRFRASFHLPSGQSSAGWLPQRLEQMEECWCSPAEQISPFGPQCPGCSGIEAIPTGRAIIIPAAVIKLLPGTPPWLPTV